MAYDKNNALKVGQLETFGTAVENRFAKKSDVTEIQNAGYQTAGDVETAINSKLTSTYKAGGSVAFASLPAAEAANLGKVYNVTDAFTTTENFIEGAGQKHPAGTNVAVVEVTDGEDVSYKYDVMAGFVDLSNLVEKETGKGLSANDYTDTEKTKLGGVEEGANQTVFATDEDVAELIATVFPD